MPAPFYFSFPFHLRFYFPSYNKNQKTKPNQINKRLKRVCYLIGHLFSVGKRLNLHENKYSESPGQHTTHTTQTEGWDLQEPEDSQEILTKLPDER